MTSEGRKAATALCAIVVLTMACESPTTPSADVSGAWDFEFSAFDQRSCPGSTGLVRGCAGSGRLDFLGADSSTSATHSYRASCQTCEGAAEYGVVEQPLRSARLVDGVLEFTLAACRFTATVPRAPARTIPGTAVCSPSQAVGQEISGPWTMTRR